MAVFLAAGSPAGLITASNFAVAGDVAGVAGAGGGVDSGVLAASRASRFRRSWVSEVPTCLTLGS